MNFLKSQKSKQGDCPVCGGVASDHVADMKECQDCGAFFSGNSAVKNDE